MKQFRRESAIIRVARGNPNQRRATGPPALFGCFRPEPVPGIAIRTSGYRESGNPMIQQTPLFFFRHAAATTSSN